ncbi:MAG: phosphate/phosphite/phosphonate ABC transporter substrate-binding protein [Gammaproteobacteria bacterium]|nr:phosphate/phosphite/phosphonate ABC transporter substrate-binding protein [Gammaproteobacteria bacterium]
MLISSNCYSSDSNKPANLDNRTHKRHTYTVGVVPQFDIRRIHAIWRPILNELGNRTGHNFVLRGSATIPSFEKEFSTGNFDFAYMNPYHVVIASRDQGYIPLIRDVGRKLYGIIVVRKDSPIKSVAELDGKKVAFPAPNALGATLLSRSELLDKYQVSVIPDFVQTHSSVYLNVALGEAVAGGGVQKTLARQTPEISDSLRVLYRTQKVSPHPFVAHPRVPEPMRQKILDAMLEIGKTAKGQEMLAKIPMNQVGPATMSDYSPLDDMKLERFYQKW